MSADFRKQLEATFHDEASDHIQHLGSGLIEWEQGGGDGGSPLAESLYRAAHSLKGAARAVGYAEMETLCQAMEGAFVAVRKGRSAPSARVFDALNGARALLERMLAARRRGGAPLNAGGDLLEALGAAEEPAPAAAIPATLPSPASPPSPAAAGPIPAAPRDEPIRISAAKLEALGGMIDELTAVKAAGHRLALQVEELRHAAAALAALRSREPEAGPDRGGEASRLLDRLGELADQAGKAGRENRELLEHVSSTLISGIREALMIPVGDLLSVFPKVARDLAMDTGKRVQVRLSGADWEMEKAIVDRLRDVLLHLVRNAVDHGLEPPDARTAAGKPSAGRIDIKVEPAPGGRLALEIGDDGRGVDPEALRQSAVRAGFLTAEAARDLPEAEVLNLAFLGGLSTRAEADTLSGRGLGLAIVRERVESLGGAVSLESRPGAGARFRIVLPARRSTTRGIVIAASGRKLILPASSVRQVLRREEPQPGARRALPFGDEWLEVAPLASILGLEQEAPPPSPRRNGARAETVVVVESLGVRKALGVEAVLGEQEISIRSLGPFLGGEHRFSGAAQLLSGEFAFVLDPGALAATPELRAAAAASGRPRRQGPKRVLVVEDSITSRTLIKSLLENAGYSVALAVDGLAAWNLLEKGGAGLPDAVVSDVEMPRMDGFELLSRIRADERLRTLPVVLVTSLGSPGERARGLALGADGYVVKGEFDAGKLLHILGAGPQ